MTRTKLAFHVAAAFVLALTAQRGNAAFFNPAGPINVSAAGLSLLQKTHGCHYSCTCGPQRDFGCEQLYHRHLHMLCLPVRCDRGTDCDRKPSEGVCRHMPPP